MARGHGQWPPAWQLARPPRQRFAPALVYNGVSHLTQHKQVITLLSEQLFSHGEGFSVDAQAHGELSW